MSHLLKSPSSHYQVWEKNSSAVFDAIFPTKWSQFWFQAQKVYNKWRRKKCWKKGKREVLWPVSHFWLFWKGLASFNQLVKVRRGKLVLALPSIRFSWNFYQVSNKNRFLGSEAPPPNPSLSIWLDSGTNKLLKFVPFKWWESYLNIQFNQIIQMRRIESK